ncbi:MAG: 50S ribosomal protein L35 [Bacteroidetes bacterium]|nr:50S ribosomal protein L35 [Bacteroidota bacterium]
MPKVKTNSSAKKRFRVTGTGKIRMKHAYKAHKLYKKSKRAKRALGQTDNVSKPDLNNVKHMLGLK